MIKNYLKAILLFIIIILILSLIITTLYNYNIINSNITKILEIIALLTSSIISGFYIGLKSKNKGYINGLTIGGTITIIILLLNIIINRNITITTILVYLAVMLTITTSSIFGINKRK